MASQDVHFTGERVVPGEVDQDLWNEHISRYRLAATFVDGKRVLDVGCGTGYGTALLAERAAEATGFDVSPDAISYAASHFGDKANFLAADALHYPADNESFDIVTAFEVIEHVAEYEHLISEAARVLAPGGIFLVSTPNKPYYAETRKDAGPNPFHVHEFELDEFEGILQRAFTHVQILTQNQQEAIVFECESDGRGVAYFASDPSVRNAHFFVAICSKGPVQTTPFVYVAQAGNLLRARERHISLLQEELERAQADHLRLLELHDQSGRELERSNEWALSLDRELAEARQKLSAQQRDADDKAKWAQDLDKQLQEKSAELAHMVAQFDGAQVELVKRAQWVRDMEALCVERAECAHRENHTSQLQAEQIRLLRDELTAVTKRLAALESSEALLESLSNRLKEENRELLKQLHGGNQYLKNLQERLTAVGSMADRLTHERELVRTSKWLKLGQRLHLGPRLAEEPPPL